MHGDVGLCASNRCSLRHSASRVENIAPLFYVCSFPPGKRRSDNGSEIYLCVFSGRKIVMLSFFLGNLWLGTTAVQIQQITVDFTLLPENYLFATIIII